MRNRDNRSRSPIDSRIASTVHLSDLPENWRHQDLHKYFTKYYGQGTLSRIRGVPGKPAEAVVEFHRPDDAKRVKQNSPLDIYDGKVVAKFLRDQHVYSLRHDDTPPPSKSYRDHHDDRSYNRNRDRRDSGGSYGISRHYRDSDSRERVSSARMLSGIADNEPCHTLFVGNLDQNIEEVELQSVFRQYGLVQEIDIKKSGKGTAPYAFIRFLTMEQAKLAKDNLNGTRVGGNQLRIGYGKSKVSPRLWVGGLKDWCTPEKLVNELDRYGSIEDMKYFTNADWAFVQFESTAAATVAYDHLKNTEIVRGHKIKLDYAELDDPYTPFYTTKYSEQSVVVGNSRNHDDFRDDRKPHRRSPYDRGMRRSRSRSYDRRSNNGRTQMGERPTRRSESSGRRSRRNSSENSQKNHIRKRIKTSRSPVNTGSKHRAQSRSSTTRNDRNSPNRSPSSRRDRRQRGVSSSTPKTIAEWRTESRKIWEGTLALKHQEFPIQCHLVEGDTSWLQNTFARTKADDNKLKIKQRLRLEQRKLDDVRSRMAIKEHGLLLVYGVNNGNGCDESTIENLESYMVQKDAAGVAYCEGCSFYVFPTCEFANSLIQESVPQMKLVRNPPSDQGKALLMIVVEKDDSDHFQRMNPLLITLGCA